MYLSGFFVIAFLAYTAAPVGSIQSVCKGLTNTQPLEIHWWNIEPYIFKNTHASGSKEIGGKVTSF